MGENWFWANPVAVDGLIYAPCLDGNVYVIDNSTGEKVDLYTLESPVSSSPVMVNENLIMAARDGLVYSLNTETGNLEKVGDVENSVFGALTAAGGIVYIHTQDLTIHRLDTNNWSMLSSVSLERTE
jgi:outer membrane protein assembly factor BamB